MKEKEPNKGPYTGDGDNGENHESGGGKFNREDSTRTTGSDSYEAFTKDKRRKRITTTREKVEYKPREYTPREQGEGDDPEKRRSYNPNFTPSNKPAYPKREYQQERPEYDRQERGQGHRTSDYQKREYGSRPGYGERREYNKPGQGEKRDYNRDGQGDRRPYEKKPYGSPDHRNTERRPYGGNDYGARKPYGDREQGERKPYDQRKPYDRDRDSGERKPYDGNRNPGERKPYGDRPYGNKPYGEKRPYGNKPYGAPQGDNRFKGRNNDRRPQAQFPRYDSENYPSFPAPKIEDKMRLNRYIAMSGVCSRREADDLIQAGHVSVNGEVVTELGAKVSEGDVVRYNNEVIRNEKKVYIVMNKPKGYVTTIEDPHADRTVMDLLKNGVRERVYPVGRLDKSSMGVLLITNDGDLAKKLMHPAYGKKKIYQVALDKPLTKADMTRIAEGIDLDDGEIHADAISYVGASKTDVGVEIHSGRNRIVRRMFEHCGYRVLKLDRVYFAGLTKKMLRRGEWRFLTPREVQMLQSGQYE